MRIMSSNSITREEVVQSITDLKTEVDKEQDKKLGQVILLAGASLIISMTALVVALFT